MVERWVPGVAAARSYRRGWLRSDLVAGLVLAAILVPQGMAYAELAGLPAVTGLYTTIACLVGYAIFGPSRVLVLGPDSSVSPLIFAAITPLLVTNDPGSAVVLAGMLAMLVGLIEIGPRPRQARLRRRPPLERGAGRLHERPGHHDHRGPAPEALRLLHRRRRVLRRAAGVRSITSTHTQAGALAVGLGVLLVLLVLPRFMPKIPAVLVAVAGATVVSAVLDLAANGVATVGHAAAGVPDALVAVDVVRRRRSAAPRRHRHRARVAHRHHRDRVERSRRGAATSCSRTRR